MMKIVTPKPVMFFSCDNCEVEFITDEWDKMIHSNGWWQYTVNCPCCNKQYKVNKGDAWTSRQNAKKYL